MGSKYFPGMSVENFINELLEIKEMFPFIEAISSLTIHFLPGLSMK